MRKATLLLASVLAGLMLVTACTTARNDDAIATDIKAKMFSDAQLKDSGLQVAVSKGQATLTGSVPSDAARYEAFKLATDTPGVTKVVDQMTVPVAQATPAPAAEPAAEATPPPAHRTHRKARPVAEEAAAPTAPPVAAAVPAPAAVAAPAPPPRPQARTVEVPAGTTLRIQMIDSVDSAVNHTGEEFHASLDAPIVVDNEVIVPKGADVTVRLVQASSAGHISGRSELRLELVKMDFQGRSYALVSSTYDEVGTSRGKRTAATVGGGAGLGALIGAIAGGGKGAAIGAGVGAASGGVYQGVTKGKQVKIPSETKLDFRLEQPLSLTYMPHRHNSDNPDNPNN